MIKRQHPPRHAVQRRPSRIRREPPAPAVQKGLHAYPAEREAWTVVVGVMLFSLAIGIIVIGVGNFIGR